jgi:hypothetical protein
VLRSSVVVAAVIASAQIVLVPPARADGGPGRVVAFPGPGWGYASPRTELTFAGASPGVVSVSGSISGPHPGTMRDLRDRPGAVFTPDQPFQAGERVTVRAATRVVGARGTTFTFRVARPENPPFLRPDFSDLPNLRSGPRRTQGVGQCRLRRLRLRTLPHLRPAAYCVPRPPTPGAARGRIFVAPRSHPERRSYDQHGVMMFSARGRLLWYARRPDVARDVKVVKYRGQRMLAFHQTVSPGVRHHVLLDQRYRLVRRIRARNGYETDLHELQITPRDTAYVAAYQPVRLASGLLVTDYVIQELDLRTRDVLFEWHSLDHVPVSATYQPRPPRGYSWDYFHGNSIDLPGRYGTLIVSARNTSAIYGIDRRTGRLLWTFGGRLDEFGLVRRHPEQQFCAQHDARRTGNGTITLFDNGGPVLGTCPIHRARVQRFRLSVRGHRARLVREISSYRSSPDGRGLYAWAMGSARLLRGGNALINWGTTGQVTEVARDGTVVFGLRLAYYSYRAVRSAWRGRPTGKPAVVARRRGPRSARVWVSWNGATEVRRWQVMAGPEPDRLADVGPARRFAGLETMIRSTTRAPYVAVRALNARGEELGRSRAARVR